VAFRWWLRQPLVGLTCFLQLTNPVRFVRCVQLAPSAYGGCCPELIFSYTARSVCMAGSIYSTSPHSARDISNSCAFGSEDWEFNSTASVAAYEIVMPAIRKICYFIIALIALRRENLPVKGRVNMRVLGVIGVLFRFAFPTDIYAQPAPATSQQFQTRALFNLDVQKSKVLNLG
jgi:hypothetical protein